MSCAKQIDLTSQYSKSYKTEANAVKAAEKAVSKYEGWLKELKNSNLRYALVVNEKGRYEVVFFPDRDQIQIGIYLAHDGFKMIG